MTGGHVRFWPLAADMRASLTNVRF